MPYLYNLSKYFVSILLAVSLAGCSVVNKIFPDRSEDYKKAKPAVRLEVPPDMNTTTLSDSLIVNDDSTSLSDYDARQQQESVKTADTGVLPVQEGMLLKRDRDRHWLLLQGTPDAVWSRVRDFWMERGFLIVQEDPATGILETDWAENRSSIPQGPIRNLIGKVFDNAYSSSYRDKFRMRLERGEEQDTTEVFITHQGMEEELEGDADQIRASVWVPRPADPELEVEKLKQLAVFLGADAGLMANADKSSQLASEQRANLLISESEPATLVVHEDYSRAWRSVGIALDRVGFAVEDRNRSDGVYYVSYRDVDKSKNKKGLLSRLFSSNDEASATRQYQIKLTEDGADTRTNILNAEGESEQSTTALRILNLLYEKLK